MKSIKRVCPACGINKYFREDNKTCGCMGTNPIIVNPSDNGALQRENLRLTRQLDKFKLNAKWKKQRATAEAESMVKEIIDIAKVNSPTPKKIARTKKAASGKMLEINMTDHHFGKLAWNLETLGANYDSKIAVQVFNRAFHGVLDLSPYDYYDEIWFVVGNDLFNADNSHGTTTSGTQVESDIRHEKTWVITRTVITKAIEMLRHFTDKVKVVVVRGNHDFNATFHLGDLLEVYFENYDDVEVNNRPSTRKYERFGASLIGYTHGDKEKPESLPLLMAVECREIFGQTRFHEWHIGHIHQTKVIEKNGVRVRVLPALCPPDAWHSEKGYVGNLRSTEALVWDREKGLQATVIYTDSDELIETASVVPSIVKEDVKRKR